METIISGVEEEAKEPEEKLAKFPYIVSINVRISAIDPLRAAVDATQGNGEIVGIHADLMEVSTE